MQRKKIFCKVAVLVVALLCCTACSNKTDVDSSQQSISTGGKNQYQGEKMSDEIFDFTLNINGCVYKLPAKLEDFKGSGWNYSYNENPENNDVLGEAHDTCTIENKNAKLTLTVVNPSGDVKKFSDCYVGSIDCAFEQSNECDITLVKDLKLSNSTSPDDVTKAWGEATSNLDGKYGVTLRYEKEPYIVYQFTFDKDNKLTEFEAKNWSNGNTTSKSNDDEKSTASTASTSSTSSDSSAVSTDYKAPSSLNDDLFSYTFRLQGNLYTMPMPVKELTNNGWSIVAQVDHVAAGQEAISGLRASKNGVELSFNVKNYSDKEAAVQDSMVTSVYINGTLNKDVDFELSGGIKFGMKESDFTNLINKNDFQKTDMPNGGKEYSFIKNTNYFTFVFNDSGELAEVNMGKNVLG